MKTRTAMESLGWSAGRAVLDTENAARVGCGKVAV
jgi:hypothetical protein